MSARAPLGATSRPDLFHSARSETKSQIESKQAEQKENFNTDYGIEGDADDSPLQLEHMIGFSGDFRRPVVMSPSNENLFVRSLGNLVAIENLLDPHDQKLMRGHDMPVSAIAYSPSGSLIASGQIGTKSFKGFGAPIFIWNAESARRYRLLKGLTNKVNLIEFSTDERFVAGCGEDCLFYIWDLSSEEIVYAQKLAFPASVLMWVEHHKVQQYFTYELVIGIGNTLNKAILTYEASRTQWVMKMIPYAMPPSGGMLRNFNCIDLSYDMTFVFIGTTGGEMMAFRRDTNVFRACIPICSNGLQSLAALPGGDVLIGGGDGTVKRVRGNDLAWHKHSESSLDSGVRSISLSANRSEVVISCVSGSVYRCLPDDLQFGLVCVGHTNAVSCISFPSPGSGSSGSVFATGTVSGEIRVWDITDYACTSVFKNPKLGAVLCVCMVNNDLVVSGWQDGSIRCYDAASLTRQLWYIPSAHRDGTKSIFCQIDGSLQFIASGGGDGAVRVWKLSNRELVTQYTEHSKCVVKVIGDCKSSNVLHSVGSDGTVLSFDLKCNKRVICHLVPNGNMLDMTQRRDNELELITCDAHGRIFHWDIDYRDPVMAIQDPSKEAIRCVAVSPSGRYLAFAGDDLLLKIMDIASGAMVSLGQGHSNAILAIAWTPDEQQLISCGSDSCLCVWNFYLGKA